MTDKEAKALLENKHVRSLLIRSATVDPEKATVQVAFSSEEPVLRQDYYGEVFYEVLDHSPGAVDLSRLNNGGAVLLEHDRGNQLGVVESSEISDDRVGRATLRYSTANPRAVQELSDINAGIRVHISVAYLITEYVRDPQINDDGIPTYRATKWQPYEISTVSIPADPTVGVGRSATEKPETVEITPPITEEKRTMPDENQDPKPAAPQVNAAEVRKAAEVDALKRFQEITAIGEKFELRELAMEAITNGMSADNFRAAVLDKLGQPKLIQVTPNSADIGLSDKEIRSYSMIKALRAQLHGDTGLARFKEDAAFELEASAAVAKKLGREARGIFIPHDVVRRNVQGGERALSAGTPTAGGNLIATDLLSSSFIDLLRARMLTMQMGARMLSGLTGNIAIPRQSATSTAYWIAEGASPTTSQAAFDQISMNPKTVACYTDLTRQLIMQSSLDVEALVRSDLATVIALELDRVGLNGSGTGNQPRGILQTSGIGAVQGGTNGAIPTFGNMVDLETQICTANADIGTLAYLTNPSIKGRMKQTLENNTAGAGYVWRNNEINGYSAGATTQLPNNLTKGSSNNCSPIIFGNWSDLIYGEWGALDLLVDPYSNSTSGTIRIVAMQSADVAVRHPVSFSAMVDALPQ